MNEDYELFLHCVHLTEVMANLPNDLRNLWFSLLCRDYDRADRLINHDFMDENFDETPNWVRAYYNAVTRDFGREEAIELFIGSALTEGML
jgi:hypothetical protein